MDSSSTGRTVLISVRPRFAYAILGGLKQVELRRVAPSQDLSAVVLYATAPERSILGWFDVDGVEVAAPSTLWRRYGGHTSLSRREYDHYFAGCPKGVAIKVGTIHQLPRPISLQELGDLSPPQGFSYLTEEAVQVLREQYTVTGSRFRSWVTVAAAR